MTTTDEIMALADDYAEAATGHDMGAFHGARDALRTAIEALVADAERYRWLRQYNTVKHPQVTEAFFLGDGNLDAAIDQARSKT